MKPGNNFFFILIFFFATFESNIFAEDKITSSPLINLSELKPSFEDIEDNSEMTINSSKIRKKKLYNDQGDNFSKAKFIGLDKITSKTTNITIKLGETEKFGPLEIKVLKCGIIDNSNNIDGAAAYLQVKDMTENENEKVFIFNGWTFSSDPSLAPFDHAIYDLQLVGCTSV